MCIVSIISGLSECMLEETVYTMLFSAKTQTKIQNMSQGGEPLHSWVLRAFIVHWQNEPRYCQCHWWKWATAALQHLQMRPAHTNKQEGRPGGEHRHTFQSNKLPLQLVVSGWLVRQQQKHTEGHFKIHKMFNFTFYRSSCWKVLYCTRCFPHRKLRFTAG